MNYWANLTLPFILNTMMLRTEEQSMVKPLAGSIGHYGGHKYISLTSKGVSVIHCGGCEKYLSEEQEKEKREKEIYEYAKNTFGLTKRNTNWVIIGAIASIIAALAGIISIIKS